jgi:hypothetical protein
VDEPIVVGGTDAPTVQGSAVGDEPATDVLPPVSPPENDEPTDHDPDHDSDDDSDQDEEER